ncbi:RNA-binding domain-containing protein [Tilletiaria anomala UBC 951]|uniref:RNA-binding domain-containing protein n=1 Tax=Tilletiaria anomala (strain ATCC 24038 / CBS 436.72 / UBC 951) TaxID=1037660 RepID=A0A066WGA4_TILAU|nr:RNA-binding domain-containing protein [Tilletiaria anomala UBC 951]KDN53002.1 RNA-binding domain-containing protein [Tilletiaria anomala UBC 951]
MNNVHEINRINQRELELAVSGGAGSWHDEYKDSAYVFVGGLPLELTEGDVITIFSQYGEILDINLPREKDTGKKRGFGFLMYEDQRSTVLAVDNLNGAKVLERTLRVDHVRSYKQPKVRGEDGEMEEREEQSMNAAPQLIEDEADASPNDDDADLQDPMAAYFATQRRAGSSKDSEEKARRREEKRRRKEERDLKRMRKAERQERRESRPRDHESRSRGTLDKHAGYSDRRRMKERADGRLSERDTHAGQSYYEDHRARELRHQHRSRSRSPIGRALSSRRYDGDYYRNDR